MEKYGSEKVLLEPNQYTDEQQKELVFDVMTKLGYTFNPKKGIWYKRPWKTKEGKFLFLNSGPARKKGRPTKEKVKSIVEIELENERKKGRFPRRTKTNKIYTESLGAEIYNLKCDGWKLKELAEKYEVSVSCVFEWIRRYKQDNGIK